MEKALINEAPSVNVQCKISAPIMGVVDAYCEKTGFRRTDVLRLALMRFFDIGGKGLPALEKDSPESGK